MLLAVLVVHERLAVHDLRKDVFGDLRLAVLVNRAVRNRRLERAERVARVAVRKDGDLAEHVVRTDDPELAEPAVLVQRVTEKRHEILLGKALQDKHLAARQERRVDLEGRILGRRADEDDGPLLDERQERILLRLVEAVDFVDKKDGAETEQTPLLGPRHDLLDLLDAARHGRIVDELGLGGVRDHVRKRGLADAGRSPKDHGRNLVPLDHLPQELPLADEMLLTDELREIARTHPRRERLPGDRRIHSLDERHLFH